MHARFSNSKGGCDSFPNSLLGWKVCLCVWYVGPIAQKEGHFFSQVEFKWNEVDFHLIVIKTQHDKQPNSEATYTKIIHKSAKPKISSNAKEVSSSVVQIWVEWVLKEKWDLLLSSRMRLATLDIFQRSLPKPPRLLRRLLGRLRRPSVGRPLWTVGSGNGECGEEEAKRRHSGLWGCQFWREADRENWVLVSLRGPHQKIYKKSSFFREIYKK